MIAIMDIIRKGWPENRKDLPQHIQIYFNHRDELSTDEGIVFKGEKVVIPK